MSKLVRALYSPLLKLSTTTEGHLWPKGRRVDAGWYAWNLVPKKTTSEERKNHLTLSRGGVWIPHSPDNTLPVGTTATGEEGHARGEGVVDGLLQEVESSHAASIHVHKLLQRITRNTFGQGREATAGRRGRGVITIRKYIYGAEEQVGNARFYCASTPEAVVLWTCSQYVTSSNKILSRQIESAA